MGALNAAAINTRFLPQVEKGQPKPGLKAVIDFAESAYGTFRGFQFIEKIAKAISMVFAQMGPLFAKHAAFAKDFAKGALTAWCWLAIPRLFGATASMAKAFQNFFTGAKVEEVDGKKKNVNKIKDADAIADGVATYGFAAAAVEASVKGTSFFANLAAIPDLVHQTLAMVSAGTEFLEAQKLHQYSCENTDVKQEVHDALKSTMRHRLILLAKAVISVATGVLGLSLLAFGGPVLPAVLLLVVSIAGTVFAISGTLYKATHKVLDFDLVYDKV
jgi:hypothetical protein